jgi:hypothetical protein
MTTTAATDFDIARLRARRTNKWHKFPSDVLPAWVADMDFGVAPSIRAYQHQGFGRKLAAVHRSLLRGFAPLSLDLFKRGASRSSR